MRLDGYIDFEWDEGKAETNLRKHGVSFESAADAFSDPYARVVSDPGHSDQEERFFLIGMDLRSRVLTTCYCERHGGVTIRIISARKSTKVEERQYWRYRNE
ncbi:MAG: BrnT family toxin [Coriobacteriaceae bacterium]|uniref:BrnT family toxin n=1 Tax=Tractidigestivibacter sp. TaxID=2847320 RepID=UPI002A9120F9|nr:BrnT family toxin [Tractidigestivibacter sp.]MCI6547437.1 BrnT family toxin [Coriobacteriaceae bacterium]MCI6843528.1 BrnT family toxin [Coriobacteriaceae bacterium]MCI7437670.1 BrnT family toxin [Coriobacteriaceae bacterium]MDY5270736.1 BrnT family toxin [Tractidigestivibacter sp.]